MAYRADTKTTFEPSRVIQPIYTGGSVALSQDGSVLASCVGEEALLTDFNTGVRLARIEGDGEPITTLSLTHDVSFLVLCSRSLSMRVYALQSLDESYIEAKLLRSLKPHTTPVVTTAVDSTGSLLATGSADGVVKVWDLQDGFTTHTFHGHSGVISALHFFQVSPEESEQSSKNKKKHTKQQDSEASEAQNDATLGYRLASGGEDGKIRVWDLHKRKGTATLDSHVSVVRSLDYSSERRMLLSASRDKTAIIWDSRTWQQRVTIPVLEAIESAGYVEAGRFFYTGGETARLRIWSTETGNELTEEQPLGTEIESILDILKPANTTFLLSIRANQTLLLHSTAPLSNLKSLSNRIAPLPILRRISGTHDEVIDLAYIGRDRNLLALATNLEDIRVISLETSAPRHEDVNKSLYFGADVALLKGHEDIIISISTDWSGQWLATGAKDNTAKLWRLDVDHSDYRCYATFTGHAESISAVCLPSATPAVASIEYKDPLNHPPKFLITGSQDKTVKRWEIGPQADKVPRAAYTRKAHDKDINAIAGSYSISSSLFASASQDRTVKIWDADTGEAIGVLRGHKRGVWSVAFAPSHTPSLTQGEGGGASSAKGMIVTGGGDKTVRIWSLNDYSCLRTFEGHANSVLKVIWLPPPEKKESRGAQVASAAGDGLVKVWNAQSGECAATLDNHIDRVWALAVKPPQVPSIEEQNRRKLRDVEMQDGLTEEDGNETKTEQLEIVSGSADSTLTFWADTTAFTALAATTQATQRVEQDQELQNHIRANNYREAIVLALQLNHPKRLLELFSAVVDGPHEPGSLLGKKDVDEVLVSLSDSQLWGLLRRVRDWNTNGRTYNVAQRILYTLFRLVPKERLLDLRRRQRTAQQAIDQYEEHSTNAMAESTLKEKSKESVKDVLDGLKAYTERHYTRLEKTTEERFVLLWALQQMDAAGGEMVMSELSLEMGGDVLMLNGTV